MLQLIYLTDDLAVSAQPEPSDMADLAGSGFGTVVCNRPDGESGDQPAMADVQAAAEAAGMKFVSYPVNPMNFPGDDLNGLGEVFDGDGKVFAYCRSGTRCANLWVATRDSDAKPAAIEKARSFGFDLSLAGRLG